MADDVARCGGRRGATGGGASGDDCAFLSLSCTAARGGRGSEPGRGRIGRRAGNDGLLRGDGAGGRVTSDGEIRPAVSGGVAMSGRDGERRLAVSGGVAMSGRDGERRRAVSGGTTMSDRDVATTCCLCVVTVSV